MIVDEFLYTDLYLQFYSSGLPGDHSIESRKFEGIVTYSEREEKLVKDAAENWQDKYYYLSFNDREAVSLSADTVSPYCIKLKDLDTRKLWWLYCIPFLFAGITLLVIGGRPVVSKKKK